MILYLLLAALTVTAAFWIDNTQTVPVEGTETTEHGWTRRVLHNKVVLLGIFTALFLVSALRIAIGHDYWEYTEIFDLISQNRHVSTEFGFNLLVRACHLIFGKENYLVIFGIVAFATIAIFVKALYDQSKNFGYSFFTFMMLGYYFLSFSAIRYYLVLAVAMYSMKYLFRKDYIRFALVILLAACFHKSVLVVLLLYPIAMMKWKKWMYAVIGAVCVIGAIFPEFFRNLVFRFYPFYKGSIFDTSDISYINIARAAAVIVFCLIYYKAAMKDSKEDRFYLKLTVMSLIVYSIFYYIPLLSRIGYFLGIGQVFLIPDVLNKIPNKKAKVIWTVLVAIALLGYFAFFIKTCTNDDVRILPYLNWILN